MYYRNKNCGECPHRSKCTTSKNGRSARIVPALEKMHKEIDECLKSEEGKRLMRNRSAQAEGAFADIKQDFISVIHRRFWILSFDIESYSLYLKYMSGWTYWSTILLSFHVPQLIAILII